MSSRENLTGQSDSDRGDDPAVAEAMAEVARAEARAEAARARATLLSREASRSSPDSAIATSSGQPDPTETASARDTDGGVGGVGEAEPASTRWTRLRRRLLRRPGPGFIAAAAGVVLIGASLAVSGYALAYHRKTVSDRQRTAEFAAAARHGATMLMSIDAGKARQELQQVIDDATGSFKTEMLITANDRAEQIEQSKVSTKAAVTGVAVESMTKDSAVVLVTAKSEVVDDKAKSPQHWRLVMTLQRDGGQLKIAKLEFVR